MTKRQKIILLLSLTLLGIGSLLLGSEVIRQALFGQPQQIVRTSGKALIGGPFSLIDHTGKRVSDKDFRGKYLLIYFGYTFCPDVCPAELQIMSAALDKLGKKAEKIQPLFITIDPERDDVKQMSQYVGHFHKTFVGLTGNVQETTKAAKTYRVYFAKVKDKSSSADYIMDHSSLIYLMDGEGNYVAHFTYGTSPDKIAKRIAEAL